MSEYEQKLNMLIAENIRDLLSKNNRTQLELGEYLGVTQATVSNWCNGIKMPRMDKIDKICEFFNVKRSRLMSYDPSEPSSSSVDQTDSLFIDKYGRGVYDHAMKYDRLDDTDKGRIDERVDIMLDSDKYKGAESYGEKVI